MYLWRTSLTLLAKELALLAKELALLAKELALLAKELALLAKELTPPDNRHTEVGPRRAFSFALLDWPPYHIFDFSLARRRHVSSPLLQCASVWPRLCASLSSRFPWSLGRRSSSTWRCCSIAAWSLSGGFLAKLWIATETVRCWSSVENLSRASRPTLILYPRIEFSLPDSVVTTHSLNSQCQTPLPGH